jgi:hypothetical protein
VANAADGGNDATVVHGRDRGELTVVEERRQADQRVTRIELGLGGRLGHVMRS